MTRPLGTWTAALPALAGLAFTIHAYATGAYVAFVVGLMGPLVAGLLWSSVAGPLD